jgi:hypothetical protein
MYRQVVKQFDLSEDGRAVLDRWYPNVLLREFSRVVHLKLPTMLEIIKGI